MNNRRYPVYAVAILAGSGIALWAGLPPFFLILLMACPLMMFFMMRGGMHVDAHSGHGGHGGSQSSPDATKGTPAARRSDLDGSHERIDRS